MICTDMSTCGARLDAYVRTYVRIQEDSENSDCIVCVTAMQIPKIPKIKQFRNFRNPTAPDDTSHIQCNSEHSEIQ
jgi:hypothetical protein